MHLIASRFVCHLLVLTSSDVSELYRYRLKTDEFCFEMQQLKGDLYLFDKAIKQ